MMKRFIINSILFTLLLVLVFCLSLFFIPNRRIYNNSLYAHIDKMHRLDSLASPKIIFVGGSNLAYGLNSKKIQDSLGIPVVNMGLHAGFGLKFMMQEVKTYVKQGDIIILSPEYHHFFSKEVYNGETVLVALLVDVDRTALRFLSFSEMLHLVPLAVKYGTSKMVKKQMDVMGEGAGDNYESVYKRNSFNEFGDEVMHWEYPNQEIASATNRKGITHSIFDNAIEDVAKFKNDIINKKAHFYLIPPAYQFSHYMVLKPTIKEIENQLKQKQVVFQILPNEFAYPDTLFFNTVYHLNKQGVDLRTTKIINFLKSELEKK